MVNCPVCGTGNDPGRKFCLSCGTRLLVTCPTCGTAQRPGRPVLRRVRRAPGSEPNAAGGHRPGPGRRRRSRSAAWCRSCSRISWVSPALAEDRDPEAVRELLTRYFDLAREVIDRYGGTVEKFIGDAVMAVWGAPVAREDDAERAVRAAMDLVDVVRTLGRNEDGEPGPGARERAHW